MILAEPTPGHPGPNFWIRIGAFNLALAVTAGAFVGIGLRALLLAWMDRGGNRKWTWIRAIVGTFLLLDGAYYLYVAWPMIIWDRPARIFFMLTALAPPIVAAIRYSKGGLRGTPSLLRQQVSLYLTFILFITAALTLLRAGFITLKGDRVAMLLWVTGESQIPANRAGLLVMLLGRGTEAHHVILLLPDGSRAVDDWIPGNKLAFQGRAVIFSHALNALGFPNLYELERVSAVGGNDLPERSRGYVAVLPHIGASEVRPSWAPIKAAILRAWPRADQNGSPWWGVRIIENQSPDYPLVNPDGTPLKKDFLFDITLDGIPTSRYTSPLEKR